MTGSGSRLMDLLSGWDGKGMVVRRDRPTGAWIFVALHDDTLGPPAGGTRMHVYEQPSDGARDAMRLASGMTSKWAALDLPFGGGKAVLATPRLLDGEERRGLLGRYGELLETLNGSFGTGEDLGTTPEDMAYLAGITRHVVGIVRGEDAPRDPGPFTALGVQAGIRAALGARTSSRELEGRSVLIQGIGDVGLPLARGLAEAGVRVMVADLDRERAEGLANEIDARVVAAGDVYDTECDVFAPCAVGGVLNSMTIAHLRCRIVAGSANNQLDRPEDAERLRGRGILYAPDYVVNGGGAMAFGLIHLGERDPSELERRVRGIGDSLAEIFEEAEERGEAPVRAAERRVERILSRGPRPAESAPAGV